MTLSMKHPDFLHQANRTLIGERGSSLFQEICPPVNLEETRGRSPGKRSPGNQAEPGFLGGWGFKRQRRSSI